MAKWGKGTSPIKSRACFNRLRGKYGASRAAAICNAQIKKGKNARGKG